jgi:branched-chain amino acid transport system substrate-binding protein
MLKHLGRAALAAGGLALLASGPAPARADDNVITMGAAVSLTGKYSASGEFTQKGYDLAVKAINDAGGVKVGAKTYMLKVVYYDDESTPARGAQLVERLINQDHVDFILGPYSSGLTVAIAPVTEKYGVPMVEANGAAKTLFENGYRYLFAVLSTTDQYLSSAVQLAVELNGKAGRDASSLKIAGAFENDPFSQEVGQGVMGDAKKLGMQVVIDDQLPPDINDMAATLAKVKVLKPDLLVVSGHDKGALLAIRQIQEMHVDVPMLAMTHCDSSDIIGQFGKAAEYTLCASQWAPTLTYRDDVFGSASDFAATYKAAYGKEPPYQAAESAAAIEVYADAFRRAGSLDKDAVRDALAATDLETFYGHIKFDETGKSIDKPMVLYQVQDGQYVVVAPTRWAAAPVRWPTPPWSQRQ